METGDNNTTEVRPTHVRMPPGTEIIWRHRQEVIQAGRALNAIIDEHLTDALLYGVATMPSEPEAPEPTPTFQAEEYARVLASQIGANMTDIPESVLADIKRRKTKSGVNEVLIPWYTDHKSRARIETPDLTPEDMAFLSTVGTAATSQRVQTMRDEVNTMITQINRKHAEIYEKAKSVHSKNMEINALLQRPEAGVLPHVQAIVADGWYKYSKVETDRYNASRPLKSVVFVTPDVVMQAYNEDTRETQQVRMGKYKVVFEPSQSAVKVLAHEGNTQMRGYIHPHVGSSGDVCWGNAGNAVSTAVRDCNPKPMLDALKVILQTYNSDSPYVSARDILAEQARRLHPQTEPEHEFMTAEEYGYEYTHVIVHGGDLHGTALNCDEIMDPDDDFYGDGGNWKVQIYVKVRYMAAEDMFHRVDERYYIQCTNAVYRVLDEDTVRDWVES